MYYWTPPLYHVILHIQFFRLPPVVASGKFKTEENIMANETQRSDQIIMIGDRVTLGNITFTVIGEVAGKKDMWTVRQTSPGWRFGSCFIADKPMSGDHLRELKDEAAYGSPHTCLTYGGTQYGKRMHPRNEPNVRHPNPKAVFDEFRQHLLDAKLAKQVKKIQEGVPA